MLTIREPISLKTQRPVQSIRTDMAERMQVLIIKIFMKFMVLILISLLMFLMIIIIQINYILIYN